MTPFCAALYVGFFVLAFLRIRGRHPLANWGKVVLAMGLYQLAHSRVPAHAAISESVDLCRTLRMALLWAMMRS